MKSSAWTPTFTVVGLLSILTYLWMQNGSQEIERRNRLQTTLRIMELRDAELMRDILLARAGLLPNYDGLTQSGQDLIRLSYQLRTELKPASDAEQVLGKPVTGLAKTIRDKLMLVEHFKSDNALLRNSASYFDLVGKSVRPRANSTVARQVGRLWLAMFSFMETPEPRLGHEIRFTLDRLSKIPGLPEDYRVLVAHGRLIVAILPKLDAQLRGIIDYPVVSHENDFQNALNQYGNRVEARAQAYRLLLYLTAVVLVGYLLYQFALLRAHTLDLRLAHAKLQQETAERLQAETALHESAEQLRAITDSVHEAIVSTDGSGTIVSWNRGATAMFGYSLTDALGSSAACLIPGYPKALSERLWEDERNGSNLNSDTAVIEVTGVSLDRGEFPLELSLSSWKRGSERYITAIMRDVTARKRLEKIARQQQLKLIQANKMAALGVLVSGVAHEIGNPNQLILMNADLLAVAWNDALSVLDDHYRETGMFSLGGLPYPEMRNALPVLIHDIADGARRIERTVADLKNFARPQHSDVSERFSLNNAVNRALRLLTHLIDRKTAHFKLDLTEPLALLQGNPQQVEQIVINLLVNALEALPDRTRGVTVSTCPGDDDGEVSLEIRDEGIGIAPEHLKHLCDPFFTTKQAIGGTGLGLAITASLLRAHAGHLSFFSAPGKGTCALVRFPAAPR